MAESSNANAHNRANNTPSNLQGIKRELIVTGDLSGQMFGFATRIARIDSLLTNASMRSGQFDEIRKARKTLEDAFELLDRAIKTVTSGLNKPNGNARTKSSSKKSDVNRTAKKVTASPSSNNAGNKSAGLASSHNKDSDVAVEGETQSSKAKANKKTTRKSLGASTSESQEMSTVGSVDALGLGTKAVVNG